MPRSAGRRRVPRDRRAGRRRVTRDRSAGRRKVPMDRSTGRKKVTRDRSTGRRRVTRDTSVQQKESIVYAQKGFQHQIPNMRDKGDQGRRARISGLFCNLIVQWRHCELGLVERVVSRRGSDVSKNHTKQQSIIKAIRDSSTRDNNRF